MSTSNKLDIVPLIQFLSERDGAQFIRWCDCARLQLLQNEPMLAIYINEHYTMPYLKSNYAIFDADKAIEQFQGMNETEKAKLLSIFHHIADLCIIYVTEGPFTSQKWDERIRAYLEKLNFNM